MNHATITPGNMIRERYRVKRLIHSGAQGEVYEADDIHFTAYAVAVKRLRLSDKLSRKAFEHEADLLSRLRHSVLPRVTDYFTVDSEQFLVMDFIPGDDLEILMSRRTQAFVVADVLHWADQLLDALHYLHTQNPPIIHRDIKPANLKLTSGTIQLLDFGLAKVETTVLYGHTPAYAPPEQILGRGTDARSDLYALAATLYQLLTNTAPVVALQRSGEIDDGRPDPLLPPHQHNPLVPPAISAALMQALMLDPNQRYASATTMRSALQTVSNPRPGLATLAPGEVVNQRYRIERLTARTPDEVYQAVDERRIMPVTLQRTPICDAHHQRVLEDLTRRLSWLHHPILPIIIDDFSETGCHFLVMKAIEGTKLSSVTQPVPAAQALDWADQLLDGLEYLHTQRPPLVLGSIAPANIKLTSPHQVSVVGLGLADVDTSLVGEALRYASPEQVRGDPINARSDLYSLGATLYQLLTDAQGRLDPAQPARALNPEVPATVSDALGVALAPAPDQRFANAAAMRAALRPPRPKPRLPARFLFIAGATMLVMTILGIIAYLQQSLPPPSPSSPSVAVAPAPTSLAEGIIYREDQEVVCGIDRDLPGFSVQRAGTYEGMHADFCRAVALALFADQNAVRFEDFGGNSRQAFDAIRAGSVDVVFSHQSATFNRDIGEMVDFGPTIFHDGQGILVRATSGITEVADLDNSSVCVAEDTTSLLNLPDIAATYNITLTQVPTTTLDNAFTAYLRGDCDAVTDVRSALAAKLIQFDNPDNHRLFGPFSREPIGPFFREDDSLWAETIDWAVNCTIAAEELGVDSAYVQRGNLDDEPDPQKRRLLGIGSDKWNFNNPGLPPDTCRLIIGELGNYQEIYTRNLIEQVDINSLLEANGDRGPNKAWNAGQGGVLAAPPLR